MACLCSSKYRTHIAIVPSRLLFAPGSTFSSRIYQDHSALLLTENEDSTAVTPAASHCLTSLSSAVHAP